MELDDAQNRRRRSADVRKKFTYRDSAFPVNSVRTSTSDAVRSPVGAIGLVACRTSAACGHSPSEVSVCTSRRCPSARGLPFMNRKDGFVLGLWRMMRCGRSSCGTQTLSASMEANASEPKSDGDRWQAVVVVKGSMMVVISSKRTHWMKRSWHKCLPRLSMVR